MLRGIVSMMLTRSCFLGHQDELLARRFQGLWDVPALLSRCFNDGRSVQKFSVPAKPGSETVRDFLS